MNRRTLLKLTGGAAAAAVLGPVRSLLGGETTADTPAGQALSFVHVTDTHFGCGQRNKPIERNRKIVQVINALPMDIACVVHGGDIFSDRIEDAGTRQRALDVLGELRPPICYIPGNHDILVKGSKDRRETTAGLFREHFGPLAGRHEHHGTVFLTLYTEPIVKDAPIPDYDPITWLKGELGRAGRKPVLVFHHRPCVLDFYHNRMHDPWTPERRATWTDLLNSANVRGVVTGHFHRAEHHWLGDVPMFVTSSVAGFWGRQSSFRIYTFDRGRLSYRSVYIEVD
ncbi:MAG: hypothetical protein GVY16_10900 [Planctomycetes bacterium]|jgi:predicted MPP superfamily phosphohydrolase|nr:metallophosphoesterase [Phycisphaerae bacterium]NBB96230.1 hypothetical protein [Planctomycetota bacterium]